MLIQTHGKGPCPTPAKRRFGNADEAQFAADYIFDDQGATLEPYGCVCGVWHLTTPAGLKGTQEVTPSAKGGTRKAQRRSWYRPLPKKGKSGRRPRTPD